MTTVRLREALARGGLKVFTPSDFRRALGLKPHAAYMALARYAKQGALRRLRSGLYALPWVDLDPLLVANQLFRPSYVSYETALSFHHLIPETVYAVTSATPRRSREIEALGTAFIYHKIKSGAYTGYRSTPAGQGRVLMAEPEKALCDYLHLVFLKRKTLNDRIAWNKVNIRRLLGHARSFKPIAFSRWIRNVIP